MIQVCNIDYANPCCQLSNMDDRFSTAAALPPTCSCTFTALSLPSQAKPSQVANSSLHPTPTPVMLHACGCVACPH